MKVNEMGRSYRTHGRRNMHTHLWYRNLNEGDHYDAGARIILKRIIQKYDEVDWIHPFAGPLGSYKPQYCGHIFGLLYIFPG
jgi:hypothetical protein